MHVLDCNAALNIIRGTVEGERLAQASADGERVISTTLFYPELCNSLWKYVRAGKLNISAARELATQALALVDEFHDMEDYYVEALNEACRLGHPAYDFFYLLLAKRTGATLLTCDRKLASLAEEEGVRCAS